jgi:hypothetical protein
VPHLRVWFGPWQVLVRMALMAYAKADSTVSVPDKVKGFFLLMWRNVTKVVRKTKPLGRFDSSSVVVIINSTATK